MSEGTVYVIGAGLSGLSAAVAIAGAGRKVKVIEAANQAGGRCRSYFDSTLGRTIDNGNHLVLSGNHATFDYLRAIGAEGGLVGPNRAEFNFVDLRDGKRWTITPNDGPLAWWVLSDNAPGAQYQAIRLCRDGRTDVREQTKARAGRDDVRGRFVGTPA